MKNTFILTLCLLLALNCAFANKHASETKYKSYKGLIMAGYQGWFRLPENKVMYPDEKRVHLDMWPDISEYEKTYPTGLKLADGSTARFFNSADKSTVDTHFNWMQEYGLDGVFMQRFFSAARPNARHGHATDVLNHAFEAASKYDRAIAIMYDLSGLRKSGEDCSTLIEDWKYLVDSLKVTNQDGAKTYLHHNGKPLVAIWGVGFPDRPYNIRNIGLERFIDFLKNDPEYGGCSIMMGVPTFWRDLNADCIHDPYLHELIKQVDIVLPWMVQRFTPLLHNDMDRFRDVILGDISWCKENNIDYVPCVCPGFSWHNLSVHEFPDDIKPSGSIPRQGGRFYWQQMSTAIRSGAEMIYVAMFDEVNEGTAIFKVSDNPPCERSFAVCWAWMEKRQTIICGLLVKPEKCLEKKNLWFLINPKENSKSQKISSSNRWIQNILLNGNSEPTENEIEMNNIFYTMKQIVLVGIVLLFSLGVESCTTNSSTVIEKSIKTEYPTKDWVISDFVVTDPKFGAKAEPGFDNRAAFQAAIDAAYENGGGVVYIPAGNYEFRSTETASRTVRVRQGAEEAMKEFDYQYVLNLPPSVQLRGDWADPELYDGKVLGTILEVRVGKDAPNYNAAVESWWNDSQADNALRTTYTSIADRFIEMKAGTGVTNLSIW